MSLGMGSFRIPDVPTLEAMTVGSRGSSLAPEGQQWVRRVARMSGRPMSVTVGDSVVAIASLMDRLGGAKNWIEAWNVDFETAYCCLVTHVECMNRLHEASLAQAPAPPTDLENESSRAEAPAPPTDLENESSRTEAPAPPTDRESAPEPPPFELPLAELPELRSFDEEERLARNQEILKDEQLRYRKEWDEYMVKWRAKRRLREHEDRAISRRSALKARHDAARDELDETMRGFRARTDSVGPDDALHRIRYARSRR